MKNLTGGIILLMVPTVVFSGPAPGKRFQDVLEIPPRDNMEIVEWKEGIYQDCITANDQGEIRNFDVNFCKYEMSESGTAENALHQYSRKTLEGRKILKQGETQKFGGQACEGGWYLLHDEKTNGGVMYSWHKLVHKQHIYLVFSRFNAGASQEIRGSISAWMKQWKVK